MLGPVFWLELRRAARRGQHQRLRLVIALALAGQALLVLLLCWSKTFPIVPRGTFSLPPTPPKPEAVGAILSAALVWLLVEQMVVGLLVAPALAAGSISDEKESGTLQHLLSTPVESRHVIIGKWLAQVVQAAILGLPAVPLVLLLTGLLGLTAAEQAALLLFPLVPLPTLAAGSLLASVWSRRTSSAVLLVYGALAAAGLAGWLAGAADWLAPGGILAACLAGDGTAWRHLARFALAWSCPVAPCLVLACWRLRPAYRKQLPGEARAAVGTACRRPPVGTQPLRWKERYLGERALPRLGRRGTVLAVGLVVLATLLAHGGLLAATWWSNVPPIVEPGFVVLGLGLAVLALAALLVGVRCAAAVALERQRQTWVLLLLTPLEPRHLLRGKLWGVLDGARPYLVAYLAAALPPVVLLGGWAVLWLVSTWLATWLVMYFTAATGLECSVRAGSSWRALVRALLSSAWLIAQRFATFGVPIGFLGGMLAAAVPLATRGRRFSEFFACGFALGSLVVTAVVLLAQAEANLEEAERRIHRDERIPQGSERFRLGE